MPGKRKREKDSENESRVPVTSVPRPTTFRDLSNLSNPQLTSLSKSLGAKTKGKRNHKMTVLAKELGIPTNNANIDPFISTVDYVNKLQSGWTSDIRLVPDIRLEDIQHYLLASHDVTVKSENGDFEVYSEKTMKCYKALRSFDLYESGHVSGYEFNPLEDVEGFCAVRCLSNPSFDTSGTQYTTVAILKESGQPVGGSCLCVAGLGEACTHVGALMFGLHDFVLRGYKSLPDCQSTTEKLCRWVVPNGTKVAPKALKNVNVKKGTNRKKFHANEFNPVPQHMRDVNLNAVQNLHATLSLISPNVPWMTIAPTLLHGTDDVNVNNTSSKAPITSLSPVLSYDDECLVPSKEQELETDTKPLTIKERLDFSNGRVTNETFRMTLKDASRIETSTMGQSSTMDWYMYRRGMITASTFHRVNGNVKQTEKLGKKASTDKLVDSLVNGSKFAGNESTKYGLTSEPKAAKLYKQKITAEHKNSKIGECGLIVLRECCFLGASPDRIMICECHGRRLVEIKCPHNCVKKGTSIQDLDFVESTESGGMRLKTSHQHYTQIQGQMGITGVEMCDLVVYDGNSIHCMTINFDRQFWDMLKSNLKLFFSRFMVPVMLEDKSNGEHVDEAREAVQKAVSEVSGRYFCGACRTEIAETVMSNSDASINCECPCRCDKWFHWRCVGYSPDPDNGDEEAAWFCHSCMENCDIEF